MFRETRSEHTRLLMSSALQVLRKHPDGSLIVDIRGDIGCGRDELSTALKNLREEGFAFNPHRGIWKVTPKGMEVRSADLPRPAPPMTTFDKVTARAIAAEERAQGLAEQLAEERKRREQAEQDLRDAGDEFEQVRLLRGHLAKKARRLRKRLAEIESIGLSLSMIKDPTIPF